MNTWLAPTILTPMGSLGVLAGTAVMTYYASAEEGFRWGMEDAEGEVPLWGDVRVWVAAGSIIAGRFLPLPPAASDAANILGLGALASLTATEGLRWREDGSFFGITLPQLPAPPEEEVVAEG